MSGWKAWPTPMIRRKSQILCLWFLIWDLAMTAVAWVAAYHLRFESGLIPSHMAPLDIALCYQNIPMVVILSAVAYGFTGQYVIHRFRRLREEVLSILKGTALMGLLVIAGAF